MGNSKRVVVTYRSGRQSYESALSAYVHEMNSIGCERIYREKITYRGVPMVSLAKDDIHTVEVEPGYWFIVPGSDDELLRAIYRTALKCGCSMYPSYEDKKEDDRYYFEGVLLS